MRRWVIVAVYLYNPPTVYGPFWTRAGAERKKEMVRKKLSARANVWVQRLAR